MSHRRSQSKQSKPLKDPTEVLNSINERIAARKRILETLQEQTADFKDEVIMQIRSRDISIEELNKEIEALKIQLKNKSTEIELVANTADNKHRIAELENERAKLEEKLMDLHANHLRELEIVNNEKENLEVLNEAMTEEMENLKNQVSQKASEMEETKHDMKQLSEIMQKMTSLNQDLTKKIEGLNNEIGDMSIKSYETQVRLASIEDIEESLQEYMMLYQKSQEKNSNFSTLLNNLTEDTSDFLGSLVSRLKNVAKELHSDQSDTTSKILTIISDIEKQSQSVKYKCNSTKDSESIINSLKDQITIHEGRIRDLDKINEPLKSQINGQKEIIENFKRQQIDALEETQKNTQSILQQNDNLKNQVHSLRADLYKLDSLANGLQSKLMVAETKLKKFNDKFAAEHTIKCQVEKLFNDLKEKYKSVKLKLIESDNNLRSERELTKKYATSIQVLHEEIWKKDTQAIKSKKLALQYQGQAEKLQNKLNESENMKIEAFNKQMEKTLKELQDKEHQIELLKNVVKGSQLQVKQKDQDLFRIKNKFERYSPEPRISNGSPPPQDQSFKQSPEKISVASQTIQRFFKMASFIKAKPASSRKEDPNKPGEMKRMVNKLRQELTIYSTFSTRELVTSVPELQSYIDTTKTYIGLEEVMAAINAVLSH